ncbi:hypothetical protein [Streptomyces sp. NPDC086023]|uniref:hypothetical protein n=1 Tax=Streptomyces sp. NPDC086023 TaxID=3365746 RepID=UPI0037D78920
MDDTIRATADVECLVSLLRRAHSALDVTVRALTLSTGPGTERSMASLGRTLRELHSGSAELATAALGVLPEQPDRSSVLTALYVSEDAGRIAVLLGQAGEILQARSSGPPPAERVLVPLRELGGATLGLVTRAQDVLRSAAPPAVMDSGLAEITARQRGLERLLLADTCDPALLADAADAAVLGRCYEECAFRVAAVARIGALRIERRGQP